MQMVTYYRLDRWDGAERTNPTSYYARDEETAQALCGPHDHVSPIAMIILDSPHELKKAEAGKKALDVLRRLSKNDRIAIGLPEDENAALEEALKRIEASSSSSV